MKDLAKYLRCSSSPIVNCPLDCPYLIKEEIKEDIPVKADTVIDGVEYWTSCDIDRIDEDAADYIEQLEKKNKYRWHDLRKDPEDLPEDFHDVLICLKGFEGDISGVDIAIHGKLIHMWDTSTMSYEDEQVIAWREFEPFEEV